MAESLQVTEALTQKAAELSRLELSPQELSLFTRQLSDILGYVEQLQEVKVDEIEPLSFPHSQLPAASLRRDEAKVDPMEHPESFEGGFKVPPII